MIKIRLNKQGAKKKPFYRIVAVDESKKRSGASIEVIGIWDPKKAALQIDKKKLNDWLAKGAQKTAGVSKILN